MEAGEGGADEVVQDTLGGAEGKAMKGAGAGVGAVEEAAFRVADADMGTPSTRQRNPERRTVGTRRELKHIGQVHDRHWCTAGKGQLLIRQKLGYSCTSSSNSNP